MDKNSILKIYGTDFKEMTMLLLKEMHADVLIRNKCGISGLIGIKPNLVSPSLPEMGATTHPEIAAGIIEYLKETSFSNLIMLEGSWVGDKTSDAYELCGYRELSEKYGVPFIDLQKDSYTKIPCKDEEISICDTALKLDFLINVPVLKGHCQTRVTCALKNLKGLLPSFEKRRFHSMGLHKPIALLNSIIRQDLIITDNICGDPDFEDGGNPFIRNCIMASTDPVLTDAYACSLMHINSTDVPYIAMSEALGTGNADILKADIKILSETDEWKDCELPYPDRVVSVSDMVEEVDSCSACYGYLIPALDMLKNEGLLSQLDEKICIGQGYRGKTGRLGIGNCTSKFDYNIKGCPPTEQEIYEQLKAFILSHSDKA